ncbi:cell division protein ZapE [Rhodococcus sp. PBTS 1]|uniref:cell division protein ZapE n=1 Tax=Rhodococcus sp. PBTS 1 TaxID=1653478 RepID=UPI001EEDFBEB|nr:cell division protein ZapE [Rhodococcus sp. PBTS 1]
MEPAAVRQRAAEAGMPLDASQLTAVDALSSSGSSGVFLYGPVGRGKSWLMDCYFDLLPTEHKTRVHFHTFFAALHALLHRHGHRLDDALDDMLGDVAVVCFDEFQVDDPADGLFVRRLLDALLARSVRLIVTSNQPPSGLMPNPLFHSMFTDAIALIESAMLVVEVDTGVDYRTVESSRDRTGFATGRWIHAASVADAATAGLVWPEPTEAVVLTPNGHPVRALATRPRRGQVWFDFADLCATPTAPTDYAAVADVFTWWVISGVPDPSDMEREPTRRFVHVVDVLYDRSLRTDLVTCSTAEHFLSRAGSFTGPDRTISRLHSLHRSAPPHQP